MQQVICISDGIWYGRKEPLVIGKKYSLRYTDGDRPVAYIYRDGIELGFCTPPEWSKIFTHIDIARQNKIDEILT